MGKMSINAVCNTGCEILTLKELQPLVAGELQMKSLGPDFDLKQGCESAVITKIFLREVRYSGADELKIRTHGAAVSPQILQSSASINTYLHLFMFGMPPL